MKTLITLITYFSLTLSSVHSEIARDLPENNYTTVFTEEELLEYLENTENKTSSSGIAVIPFELKMEGPVKLSIYEKNGNLYEVLIDSYMYPGNYSVTFKPGTERLPEEFEYRIEESGNILTNSFLIKK
ncbi:MAG: hypothetical protein IPM38_06030 [Ignavibacteria bacterium]|nr:hypothetical protein [Ignavibacteria bacterium]